MRLMTVNNFYLKDKNGKITYKQNNIKNMLHKQGDGYILYGLFGDKTRIVTDYYVGLDARTTILRTDTLSSLVNEPSTNGYLRQKISSGLGVGGWSIASPHDSEPEDEYVAKSGSIFFSATNSSGSVGWGPVKNIFLSTSSGSGGLLISSAALNESISVNSGESIVLEMSLTLSN